MLGLGLGLTTYRRTAEGGGTPANALLAENDNSLLDEQSENLLEEAA